MSYMMYSYSTPPNANSVIGIEYPSFSGDGSDQLNQMIMQKVQGWAALDPDYPVGSAWTVDYKSAVTFLNSKFVSVIFWGESYIEHGAHPTEDLWELNVDLATMQEVALSDMYSLDSDFQSAVFNTGRYPDDPVACTVCDMSDYTDVLNQIKSDDSMNPFSWDPIEVTYYMVSGGIVFSMSVPHALGDHLEVQLDSSQVQQFYKPTQDYWQG